MTITLSLADARKRFSEITDAVAFTNAEFIIEKNGKPVAKLVSANAVTNVSPDLQSWLDTYMDDFSDDLTSLANR